MRAKVRLLAAAIVTVIVVAVAVVLVQEPRTPSSAAPPPPAQPATAALPATVQAPAATAAPKPITPKQSTSGVRTATHLSTGWGVDVSWPQCQSAGGGAFDLPAVQPGFVVVGINGGKPFTDNACLAKELDWGKTRTGFAAYINIDAPRSGNPAAYGARVALDGLARAQRAHLLTPVLWLDVEVLNHWSSSAAMNIAVINGALHALQQHGVIGGVYSSVPMWQQITGGARLDVPVWLATSVTDYRQLPSYCDSGLGGRPAEMAQYVAWDGHQLVDVDVLCAHAIPAVVSEFAAGRG